MSPEQHKDFYISFCNGALWPLLHNNVELLKFSREAYSAYQDMNRNYANMVKQYIAADDCLWVHDFHFIPIAAYLRQLGVKNRIGFFLHTPFPPREVLTALPVHRELISAFYAYNLVGFQTQRDLHLFQDYNVQENLCEEENAKQKETLFAHFPIGVDAHALAKTSRKNILAKEALDLKASISGRKLILGVDRLDYSKGILQRLQAIDVMLGNDDRLRRQFTFLQISPPTREDVEQYQKLRMEVETLVGHINGMYTEVDWVPIRFLARGVKRDLLSAFYRLSSVCLVTPLRDGMNLVAKEFIASQDENDPGVLILSRFAGAAEELSQAILVNPYDVNEIADAIKLGLQMPLAERQERWRAMYDIISRQTLKKWFNDYMDSLIVMSL
jgi:trehalose 6-phosphate synthase